jgi:Ca-activated chloride channel homolog
MPDRVKVGETFEIHADIYATRPTKATAKLFQGEALNGLEGVRELDLKAGQNDVVWKSVVRIAGQMTYLLELDKIKEDKFKENNRFATTIDVPGRPGVLYIEGTPQHGQPLSGALTAQQFDVDMRPPAGFPTSLKELERFDFLVVSDTPKEALSLQAQELIEHYVRDLGGGFLFSGGPAGYGLGGWQRTTVERILPVRMDSRAKQDMPSVAMSLVIDRSGSMTGLPLEMAKAAAKATVGVLSGDDLVEVIAFDSSPTRYVKMQPARNRTRISNEIARITPGGGTEIYPALEAAYQDMAVTAARKKHVILLTDGRAPMSMIREVVTSMIAEAITVTSVGLGNDIDEQLLKMIADVGGGRYHPVMDPNNLPRIFTKETELIAHAAAVEEWFPVTQVGDAAFLRGIDIRTAPNLHGFVKTDADEADARDRAAPERHGRADFGAHARGSRVDARLDQRREVAVGGRVAALARVREVLGSAGTRAHAPQAPARARHEDRDHQRGAARFGRCLRRRRSVREQPLFEAQRDWPRAGRQDEGRRLQANGAGALRGGAAARTVRLLPPEGRARSRGQRRRAKAGGRERGPRFESLPA